MEINKLVRLPEKIPADKRLHFMIGVVFTSILMLFTFNMFIVYAVLVLFSFSIEILQKITKSGVYDNLDAVTVIIGGMFVMLPYLGV
jgi:glycopeptide antibiotics resistance protein